MRDLSQQGTLLDNACDRGLRGIVDSFQGPAAHVAIERGAPRGSEGQRLIGGPQPLNGWIRV